MKKRMLIALLCASLLAGCGPGPEPSAAVSAPEAEPSAAQAEWWDRYPWNDPVACYTFSTFYGLEPGTPLEELDQWLLEELEEVSAEDRNGDGMGLWTTYAAPGVEIVTTQATEKYLFPADFESWDEEKKAEVRAEQGREYISGVRATGEGYPLLSGLKVGDTAQRCEEIGYYGSGDGERWYRAGIWWLGVELEDGVVVSLAMDDGGRYVGRSFW